MTTTGDSGVTGRSIPVRAWLTLVWFVLLLLLILGGGGLFLWFALPQTPVFAVGKIADFPPGEPQLVNLRTDVAVYVVRWQEEILVWDATPAVPQPCARIVWVATNHRFEDPCSGAKWCADGSIADVRLRQAKTLTRYSATVAGDGTISISLFTKVEGTLPPPTVRVPADPAWLPPDELYYCNHPIRF